MAIFNSYVKLPEGIQGFSRAILIEGSPTRSGTDDSSVEIFFASIWNHYHGINHSMNQHSSTKNGGFRPAVFF